MNKIDRFDLIRQVYANDIKNNVKTFYWQEKINLDIIYGREDIEQMIYMNIWSSLCKYNEISIPLKILVKDNICKTFNKIMLSNKECVAL